MLRFAALLWFTLFAVPALASDDAYGVGESDGVAYYVMLDEGNQPSNNKNGVTLVNVIGIYTATQNGHVAGGGERLLATIDCEQQAFKVVTLWVKRSPDAAIAENKDEDLERQLTTMKYRAITPGSLGAGVADFACEFVKRGATKSPSAPRYDRTGKPIEYVPL